MIRKFLRFINLEIHFHKWSEPTWLGLTKRKFCCKCNAIQSIK